MGGRIVTGNFAHDSACAIAEATRQVSVAAVTQNAAGQVASNAAEIAWARAVIASCKANLAGQGAETFQTLLRALGSGGT
jgi:hypothetical protein